MFKGHKIIFNRGTSMKKKKSKIHTEQKQWHIYVILFSEKNFYIGITSNNKLRTVFKDHFNLRYSLTKPYMEFDKNKNYVPQMFFVETFEETKAVTYSRIIAWAKLISEHEYNCINGDTFMSQVQNFEPRTQFFYDEIKASDVFEMLSEYNSLFPDFKSKKQQSARQQISIILTPEEYDYIEREAGLVGISKSAYCKQMALNGTVLHLKTSISSEYLKELREGKKTMQQAIVTIYKLGQYFPQDLEKIENYVNIVTEHYKLMVKESIKIFNKISQKRSSLK